MKLNFLFLTVLIAYPTASLQGASTVVATRDTKALAAAARAKILQQQSATHRQAWLYNPTVACALTIPFTAERIENTKKEVATTTWSVTLQNTHAPFPVNLRHAGPTNNSTQPLPDPSYSVTTRDGRAVAEARGNIFKIFTKDPLTSSTHNVQRTKSLTSARWNNPQVTALAWAHNNQLLAIAAYQDETSIIMTTDLYLSPRMDQYLETGPIEALAWSPDDTRIALCVPANKKYDACIELRDSESGKRLQYLPCQANTLVWYDACLISTYHNTTQPYGLIQFWIPHERINTACNRFECIASDVAPDVQTKAVEAYERDTQDTQPTPAQDSKNSCVVS